MSPVIQIVEATTAAHEGDIAELRSRELPLPHQYTTWPAHDSAHSWRWCRILESSGRLLSGFAIELSRSRAVPGSFVGRIERLGRALHAGIIDDLAAILPAAAHAIPHLQRLDIQIFDEDSERRACFERAVTAAGATSLAPPQGYSWTVLLPLLMSEDELLKSFPTKTRNRMLAFSAGGPGFTEEITDAAYVPRLIQIYSESFGRTHTAAPPIVFRDILENARAGAQSVLVGAFLKGRERPRDLIAFGWGRLHGDHVAYDTAGSERSDELRGLSPGDAVIWHLAGWARRQNAAWIDLGGVTRPDAPVGDPLYGISSFKRRIASPDLRIAAEYRLVARPRLHALAQGLRAQVAWLSTLSRRPVRARGAAFPQAAVRRDLSERPPILVLGSGITALGVLRVCRRARIPAFSTSLTSGIENLSRWYRLAPLEAETHGKPTNLESYLRRCRLQSAVLMPCSDAMVMQTARLPEDLRVRFPTSISGPETMSRLVDKALFAQALQAVGVPHPITRLITGPADLDDLDDAVLAGAFLKPHDSQSFFARFSVKGFRTASRAEAVTRMAEIEQTGLRVLLQEYIPGPGSLHYLVDGFMDGNGSVRGMLTRRRLRMHPREFGNSSFMVSVPPQEMGEALLSTSALLKHVGFRGIFSAEFKHDPRDGLFKMLEVNARPWWYIEFTERCGLDVCTMAYRDALGLPVENVPEFKVGERLVYPYHDFFACRDDWRDGKLSLAAWARTWVGAQQPLFNWTDPMPALADLWSTAGHRALRSLKLRRQP